MFSGLLLTQQLEMAVNNQHDIRAMDRLLLIDLGNKKIKPINLQEIGIIDALAKNGHVILTSGIIELANPGISTHYRNIASGKVQTIINKTSNSALNKICSELCKTFNLPPRVMIPKWLNISTDKEPVNPLATAIFWLHRILDGAVVCDQTESGLLYKTELRDNLSFMPSIASPAISANHEASLLYIRIWNDLPSPSFPLINSTQQHEGFCAIQTGLRFDSPIPDFLNEWINTPPCFGNLKSIWFEIIPEIATSNPELQANIELLTAVKNDNILKTRTALYDVAIILGRNKMGINNPLWSKIMHLSPTF